MDGLLFCFRPVFFLREREMGGGQGEGAKDEFLMSPGLRSGELFKIDMSTCFCLTSRPSGFCHHHHCLQLHWVSGTEDMLRRSAD